VTVALLITILVVVMLCSLAYWAVHRIAGGFNLPAPVVTMADVLIVGGGVIWLLSVSGLLTRAGL
jgi:hypothetical protein